MAVPSGSPSGRTPGQVTDAAGRADAVARVQGVFVGYRWFGRQRLAPAFPFGFGLSYTRFVYRKLAVRATASGR